MHRAGSQVLRQLHSGSLPWSFLPPRDDFVVEHDGISLLNFTPSQARHGQPQSDGEREDSDRISESDESSQTPDSESDEESESDGESDNGAVRIGGAFAVLQVDSDGSC